ncbi:hypothetical protein [Pseudomonas sp. 10-1B]|uniref:hypothetical protein n=1 Tax=Pseudomonas sp. 10-1B TaxID=1546029 RepID=UPI00128D7AFF|nr:hypothetical protein [Pseudomonas sp. 10-1B]
MAKLDFIFSVHMCALSESISVMRMLAEQAEKNLALALKEADDLIKEHEHEEETYDHYGESYVRQRTFYSCGSSIGYDSDEVLLTYKFMITQLTRRSAFLTMFGLFEHRMSQCLVFMLEVTGFEGELKGMGPIEKAHAMLKKVIGGQGITDLDHLTVIRNVMAHSNGTAKGYSEISTRNGRKSPSEKRVLSAIRKTREVHKVKGGARGAERDGRALVFQNVRLVLLEPVECPQPNTCCLTLTTTSDERQQRSATSAAEVVSWMPSIAGRAPPQSEVFMATPRSDLRYE